MQFQSLTEAMDAHVRADTSSVEELGDWTREARETKGKSIGGCAIPQFGLGRCCIRSGELIIGGRPDPLDALTGADKQGRRSEGHKCHEERILDQVLTIVIVNELLKERHGPILVSRLELRKEVR